MRVAVFENEITQVEGAFKYLNLRFYNNLINYHYYETSQAKPEELSWEDFDAIVIDIDLSKKSELDGIGLIKKIKEESPRSNSKLIVLTGHNDIEERLQSEGVNNIPILNKPPNFKMIYQELRQRLKLTGSSK
tara:strand:+ start:105 stop:503 length:399 start_codon:yes stop_codon:yes gene_type:complete